MPNTPNHPIADGELPKVIINTPQPKVVPEQNVQGGDMRTLPLSTKKDTSREDSTVVGMQRPVRPVEQVEDPTIESRIPQAFEAKKNYIRTYVVASITALAALGGFAYLKTAGDNKAESPQVAPAAPMLTADDSRLSNLSTGTSTSLPAEENTAPPEMPPSVPALPASSPVFPSSTPTPIETSPTPAETSAPKPTNEKQPPAPPKNWPQKTKPKPPPDIMRTVPF